jgi:peroxiredoxin
MESNLREGVIFRDRSTAEREGVAESCVRKLGIRFPALVDGIENVVEREYTGWPDRMYLIDRDGRVAYKSRSGHFGFHPDDLEAALRRVLQ